MTVALGILLYVTGYRQQSPYVANNSQGAESYVANNSQGAESYVANNGQGAESLHC